MDTLGLLDQAFAGTAKVVDVVQPGDLTKPTPCAEWDVRALLNHFTSAMYRLSGAVAGDAGGNPPEGDLIGDDPAGAYRRAVEVAMERYRRPGVMEGMAKTSRVGELPGTVAATINALDSLVHGWDLARAIGVDTELDPTVAAAALEFATGFVSDDVRKFAGFAPPVPVSSSAPAVDQLVAFLGRTP